MNIFYSSSNLLKALRAHEFSRAHHVVHARDRNAGVHLRHVALRPSIKRCCCTTVGFTWLVSFHVVHSNADRRVILIPGISPLGPMEALQTCGAG